MKRFISLCLVVLTLSIPLTIFGQEGANDHHQIHLQVGSFDPLATWTPLAETRMSMDRLIDQGSIYLIQYHSEIDSSWPAQVEALGGEILGFIPNNTQIVRVQPDKVAAVRSLPAVRWMGPFRADYKVSPRLTAQIKQAAPDGENTTLSLTALGFSGESEALIRADLESLGIKVIQADHSPLGPVFQLEAPAEVVPELSSMRSLNWIEPYNQPSLSNSEGRAIMGIETAWEDLGYYGDGQIVAISDSGLSEQGNLSTDFQNRLVRAYAPSEMNLTSANCQSKTTWTDLHGHGTHVAGSVLGNGALSGSNPAANQYANSHAGAAPLAEMVFMSLNTDGSSGIQCIDANAEFLAKGYVNGARISTNSWGGNDQGAYTFLAALVDDYIYRHQDYFVLYAAGNAGPGASTIGSPGTAKNVLTVGATENYRPDLGQSLADDPDVLATFSSRGPTADNRIKPDVVAPGTWILSKRAPQAPDGSFWGNFNQHYAYMGGTSMATPLTAGASAIVREWVGKQRNNTNPSAALMKALMIQGTTPLPGAASPDPESGLGRVDLKNTLNAQYQIWDDNLQGLSSNAEKSYTIEVAAADRFGTLVVANQLATPASRAAVDSMSLASRSIASTLTITDTTSLSLATVPGFEAETTTSSITSNDDSHKMAVVNNQNEALTGRLPASTENSGSFATIDQAAPLEINSFRQSMIGGGDFEDPDWSNIWQDVWLGAGIPVRTSNPNFVINGSHSMWLGGTPSTDSLWYPIIFPDEIDNDFDSYITFNVRIVDQDPGFDDFCVALVDSSGDLMGPFASSGPECIDVNGLYTYNHTFDSSERSQLAGQSGYFLVYALQDEITPHMSAFVDDIELVIDFPDVTLTSTPSSGPPGTTFLLTGKYNIPYGPVDICLAPCSIPNYIGTTYADGAGDIAAYLTTEDTATPGNYVLESINLGLRTANTTITILGGNVQPSLTVNPTSGAAGTTFTFTGQDFLPGDNGIEIAVDGQVLGTTGSDEAGNIGFTLDTAANTPAGTYTVSATDSAGRTDNAAFTVTAIPDGQPTMSVSPTSGPAGTTFTFTAENFDANEAVEIAIDGQVIGQITPETGDFQLQLSTDESTPPGQYELQAFQGNKTAAATFEVTADNGGGGGGGNEPSGNGLHITLAWTDPPANLSAATTLVNNLDLVVTGPDGTVFGNGGNSADTRNNVETIRLNALTPGTYTVTVRAGSISNGQQPYAIVGTTAQNYNANSSSVDIVNPNLKDRIHLPYIVR